MLVLVPLCVTYNNNKAYTTCVRPILEYNSVIWSLYLKKDIIKIESIQKQFTRMICKLCNLNFSFYSI